MASFKVIARGLVDRLPWGARKLARRLGAVIHVRDVTALFTTRATFRGIYASFGDVPNNIGAIENELVDASLDNLRAERLDGATGLPLLDQHRELLPMAVTMLAQPGRALDILDFGGAAGIDFRNLRNALPTLDVRYCIVDLPRVCDAARKVWNSEPRISFRSTMPEEEARFDLVHSWSAIQYVADPLNLLRRFADYRPRAILLIGSPFTAGKAFVREQLNRSVPFPQWVLSLPEVKKCLATRGYRLALHAVHEYDYNVDGYAPEYRVPNSVSLLFLADSDPSGIVS